MSEAAFRALLATPSGRAAEELLDRGYLLDGTYEPVTVIHVAQIIENMTAANDLLAALEEIVGSPTLWNTDSLAFDRCRTLALRAIAKARGES